jgi:threonine/homoserine/homoserine lactone efflux protein
MADWIEIFLKGIVAGLFIAAPVGPVALLCVKRAMYYGAAGGLAAGLGAALADAVFGAIAGFGVAAVSGWLIEHSEPIRGVGGVILIALGLHLFVSRTKPSENGASSAGLAGTFVTTFMLTLTNPITILSFITVFASLGLAGFNMDYAQAGILVAAVFLGSAVWWIAISAIVVLARGRIGFEWMPVIKRWAGILIIGFGIYALGTALSGLLA